MKEIITGTVWTCGDNVSTYHIIGKKRWTLTGVDQEELGKWAFEGAVKEIEDVPFGFRDLGYTIIVAGHDFCGGGKSIEHPIAAMQGAGVQLQYGPVYAAAAYRNRQGETGERGMIWHEFGTHQVTANAALSLGNLQRRHFVRLHLDWRSLRTDENIITTETVNGVTKPYIHGSTPIFGRKGLDLGASTNLQTVIRTCAPAWPIRSSTANRR